MTSKPDLSFPGRYRLRKRKEFNAVQTNGAKHYSRHFLVLASKGDLPDVRLGITVTTKIEKSAARRNKLKRRIREVFRHNRHRFQSATDLVVIARREACQCSLEQVRKELLGILLHNGYFKE